MEMILWESLGYALEQQKLQAKCGHNDAIAIRSLAVIKFKADLSKFKTCPIIKQVLIYKVPQWCKLPLNGAPLVPGDATGIALHQAIDKQHKIGWDNFIKGRVSKKWSVAQGHNFAHMPKNKNNSFNAEKWTANMITAI
eukprot:14835971-Ditylum_brightwellii.AAC.1